MLRCKDVNFLPIYKVNEMSIKIAITYLNNVNAEENVLPH